MKREQAQTRIRMQQRRLLTWLAVVLCITEFADAHTFFNTPNEGCGIPTVFSTCPVVCATSTALCPAALTDQTVAACISNKQQLLCVDGSCVSKSAGCPNNLVPLCPSCPKTGFVLDGNPSQSVLYPCSITPFLTLNVSLTQNPAIIAEQPNLPLWEACLTKASLPLDLANSSVVISECNIVPNTRVKSPLAPEFLVIYILMGAQLLLLLFYYLTKNARVVLARRAKNNYQLVDDSAPPESYRTQSFAKNAKNSASPFGTFDIPLSTNFSVDADSANLRFTGYTSDVIGTIVSASVIITSFLWIILLAVLVLDYYAVFYKFNFRQESDLLFNDHELLSTVFIVSWHFVLVWFLGLQFSKDKWAQFFSRPVSLHQATLVQIEKKVSDPVAIANMGAIAKWVKSIESKFRKFANTENSRTIVPVEISSDGRRFVEFECVRYVFDESIGRFEPFSFIVGPSCADLHGQGTGLTTSDAKTRLELVGENAIAFSADSFYSGIVKEFSNIFYVYQMMTLIIWMYYGYYYMGLVLTAVIIFSGISKVRVFLLAQRRVLSMANFTGYTRVLRDGEWFSISTRFLVPGDVIEITRSDQALAVDAVLIDGDAVCDESSLTGEALPVVKFSVKNDATLQYKRGDDAVKHNSIFAGCYVLEAHPPGTAKNNYNVVRAVVTATGAVTTKGRLVKDILFPTKISFVFQEHLKVVFFVLMAWGIVMLGVSVFMLGTNGTDAWFYGMFTISQILSPLLPAVLVIGQSVSSQRLAKKGILCVDLDRITLSGKVKVYCFDKTGTLTKEGLNFLGIHHVQMSNEDTRVLAPSVLKEYRKFPSSIRSAMLTCHSVTMVGNEPVGNFVDVEMFRVTEATISRANDSETGATTVHPREINGDKYFQIIKRFEFVHSSAYMTVLTRDSSDGKLYLYLKGSFEKISEICNPKTIPENASQEAAYHARQGCYVLGFARRQIVDSISVDVAVAMPRATLEKRSEIEFLGFCLFRNEIKEDTPEALQELRDGGCRVVMITGDNVDTGVFVARKCGMISSGPYGDVVVYFGDIDAVKGGREVVWRNGDDGSVVEYGALLGMLERARTGETRPIELAVTGKAFNQLIIDGSIREVLFHTRVFARMTPSDKIECVRLHMERAITAMCGDGGNDAGALKAAHSGIALSEAESSVVAHFSSRNRSIFSCVELLREARCALDVSFASYKYLIMYGEILTLLGLLQYYFNVNLSQAMWILVDGTTVPLAWALTQAKPAERLAVTRPTARLLGLETVISVIGALFINVAFGIGAVVLLFGERTNDGDWFKCKEFDGRYYDIRRWWELADSYEAEVIGIMIAFQIVNAAAIFSVGKIYRAGFWRNWVFLVSWAVIVSLLSFVTLADPNTVSCLFHVNCGTSTALERLNSQNGTSYNTKFLGIPVTYYSWIGNNVMPIQFRWKLWLLCVGNLAAVVLFQWGVVLNLGKRAFSRKRLGGIDEWTR
ncbi:hypothetical protein HK100_000591 [Physocladia obscura]|uniref:P-type ATPase A domain-containing protein n=1 Tax=Physocladia obscura TaxID=109957 RepID=A0AAD5SYE1_9FUNG|nr:hypothetical protein HK100_000591 [Physocladia obscura]